MILEVGDFELRHALTEELNKQSAENEKTVGSTLAAGMAEYQKGEDESVLDVFTRAERLMYQNKKKMKQAGSAPA